MKKWSEKEIDFLKENYLNFKIEDLAKKLNRSFHSTKHKLNQLGLNKGFKFCKGSPPKWTEKEKQILLNYTNKSIKDIANFLNKTELQIRYAIKKFNIKRKDPTYWSESEINLLKHKVNKDYSILKKLFPNRSIEAIIGKKDKLKLKRKSKFYWSDKEDKYLIENYHKKPIEKLSKKLNKSFSSIYLRRDRLIKKGYFIKDKKEFLSKYWKEQYKTNTPLKSKHNKAIKILWKDKSFRERCKNAIQEKFKDPIFFKNHKKLFLKRRNSESFKIKQEKIVSEMMKLRHKDPIQHKEILKNLRMNPSLQQLYAFNYLKSKLKQKILCNDWKILDGLMEIDIAIPKLKVAVEWDGYYWHNIIKDAKNRDARKNELLINKGWKFIRINDRGLSKEEIEYRCEVILNIIERYKNSDEYKYTGGFYI